MEYLLPSFYASLQIFSLIGLGFVIRRLNLVPENYQRAVSGFLVKVALPLYFFTRLAKTDLVFLKASLIMPLAAAVILLLSLGLSWALFRPLPLNSLEKRAGIAMASFGNSGYFPLAFIEILPLAIPGVTERLALDQAPLFVGTYLLVNSPLLWSIGNFLITREDAKFSLKDLISPPLFGILAGLLVPLLKLESLVFDRTLPFVHIYNGLQQIGSVVTPMVLVNLGAMIGAIRLRDHLKKDMAFMLLGVSSLRYLILPLLFYASYFLFLRSMKLHPAIVFTLFLETHVPPANNLSVMAVQAGVNEDVSAFMLLGTHILYILLVPLFIALFLHCGI